MSKNLTRKGLAFGAVVALGSTLIAGSPAFAADELVFSANTGTALAAPVTEALTLNASLVSSVPAGNIAQLKFKLETDGTFVAKAVVTTGGVATADQFTTATPTVTGVGTSKYVGVATSLVVAPTTTPSAAAVNTIAVSVNAIADATNAINGVAPSATTTTRTVNITAWIDADLDGVVDAAEFQKMQTVTFRKYSEITATTAITAPVEGDTTATAAVKFDNINNEQLTPANVGVHFTKGDGSSLEAVRAHTALAWATNVTTGTTTHNFAIGDIVTISGAAAAGYNQTAVAVKGVTSTTAYTTDNVVTDPGASTALGSVQRVSGAATLVSAVAWSSTKFFKYTSGAFAALAKTDAVKVQPLLKGSAIAIADYSTAKIATAATASVTARSISTLTADAVRSSTAALAAAGTADVALNSTFQVSAVAKNTTTTPAKPVVGAAVTAKIEVAGVTLSSTKTVTVNGVTYSDATKLPGYNSDAVAKISAGSTDANGAVTLTITTVGFAATNDVTVTFYAENFNAAVTANAADSVFSAYLTNAVDAVSTTDGVAAKLDFVVRDQFGNKPANATYEISTDGFVNGQTTAGTSASQGYTAVVDGAASLSILDNGTGTGVNTYDIYLGKRASNGTIALTQIRNDFRVQIVAAADLVAGTILEASASLDTDTGVYTETVTNNAAALALADFVAYDSRSAVVAGPDAITPATGATIAGTVTTKASATAAAVAVDGAAVTITGAGLQFVANIAAVDVDADGTVDAGDVAAQKVYGIGSLTVYTDNSGAYRFTVYSNKSGKQTVTLTSGAATRTVIISTFAAAATTTGTSLVLTAPATMLPGRTLEISGLLTDKYGNAVAAPASEVSIAYDGPGLVVGTFPTAFDEFGAFKFRVLLGASETGSATVTVKYDQKNDNDYTGTTGDDIDLVKTATVTIGAAAVVAPKAAVIASKNGRVYVTVNSPAGFKSYVKVGFSVKPAFTTTGSKLVSYFVGSGKRVAVVVFVRGGVVASQAVTVK